MTAAFFSLPAEEEDGLDPEAREIVDHLRRAVAAAHTVPATRALAIPEDRHLRLRLIRAPNDWVELLVGDGYTEFTVSGESTYKGYLAPWLTVDRVRRWMSRGPNTNDEPMSEPAVIQVLDTWAARRGGWAPGRYRFRTWARTKLPFALLSLAPAGRRACGNHEWHNADGVVERCYHCCAMQPARPEWRRRSLPL